MNKNYKLIRIWYVLFSALFFAVSSAISKIIIKNYGVPGGFISFSRFLGDIILWLDVLIRKKGRLPIKYKYIVIKGIFNTICLLIFSIDFRYTTITNANMLQMTYPIFVILLTIRNLNQVRLINLYGGITCLKKI